MMGGASPGPPYRGGYSKRVTIALLVIVCLTLAIIVLCEVF